MRALVAVVVVALAGCSGGPSGDARFTGAGATGEPASASNAPPGRQQAGRPESAAVALPKNLPPAAMFLASGSHRTTPSRYCLGDECALLRPPAPPALEGPSESPVLFTLSAAPKRAQLEVVRTGRPPEMIGLTPGSSMSWQPAMEPGSYRLTLTATYDTTEVSWPFALAIVEGTRR
ncbi:MAG TPA: hypothetical protein VGB64_03325 [Actinomycetota bacterium]